MAAERPNLRKQLIIIALTAAMVLLFICSLAGFWRMQPSYFAVCCGAAGAALYGWLHWRFPHPMRWATVLLPVLSGLSLAFTANGRSWLLYLWDLLAAFALAVTKNPLTTMDPLLADIFLYLVALAAGAWLVWEALRYGSTFWSLALGTVVFGSQWTLYYEPSAGWYLGYAILALAAWAVAGAARRDSFWRLSGRRVVTSAAFGSALLLVAGLGLVAVVAPSHFAPMDLSALSDQLERTFPALQHLRGGGAGGSGGVAGTGPAYRTGFSSAIENLGGPVSPDPTTVLTVDTDPALRETLYLRGDVRVRYTGQGWQPAQLGSLTPAPQQLPAVYAQSVPRSTLAVTVNPDNLPGTTVFTALETQKLQFKGDDVPLRLGPDLMLLARRPVVSGNPYTLAVSLPQVVLPQVRSAAASTDGPPNDLQAYLELPRQVPTRVVSLAQQVAAGSKTRVDQALDLEEHLRTHYRYSLDSPAPPGGRDFVDYFLFDGKTGYCTYYSTAMVVMLRSLGIPARWVQGFVVAPPTPDDLDLGRTPAPATHFDISGSQAHAWVEAYFPQYGWVTFDPTPRFSLPNRLTELPNNKPAPEPPVPGEQQPAAAGSLPGSRPSSTSLFWLLGALVAALAVAMGLKAWRVRKSDAVAEADPRTAVQQSWDNLEGLMAQMGTPRPPAQTAAEYAGFLAQRWPELAPELAGSAARYDRARYAPPGHPIDPAEVIAALTLWQAATRVARERFGGWGYTLRRLRPVRGPRR